jgi:F420-0:gamma-glutamyl ligase
MIVTPIQTHIFSEGDNLFSFITRYFRHIPETSIIVITSKIVALSEKRTISRERATKKELVTQESTFAIPTKYVDLTITQGVLIASAGIDESNAENDKFILLPKDSYRTARLLHTKLQKKYQVKNLGVIITDSVTLPLRAGSITNRAAGIPRNVRIPPKLASSFLRLRSSMTTSFLGKIL